MNLGGTLRVLLVLLHDFPEFLCDHHYNFCDVIPPNCIQVNNVHSITSMIWYNISYIIVRLE